jgi:hypothetical protein
MSCPRVRPVARPSAWLAWSLLVVGAALAGGCGDDDGDDDGPVVDGGGDDDDDDDAGGDDDADAAPAGGDLDAFGGELVTALCGRFVECCEVTELEAFFEKPTPTSVEECVDQLEEPFAADFARIEASIEAGRMRFDAAEGDACVAAFAASSCSEFAALLIEEDLCGAALVGLVETGGVCRYSGDCAIGTCDGQKGGTLDGTCYDDAGEGDSCAVDTEGCPPKSYCSCAAGLHCDYDDTLTCVADEPEGTDCSNDDECATDHCEGNTECAASRCDGK